MGSFVLVGFSAGFINYKSHCGAILRTLRLHESDHGRIPFIVEFWFECGFCHLWCNLNTNLYQRLLKEIGHSQIAKAAYSSPIVFIMENPGVTPIRTRMVSAYNHIQWLLSVVGLCCVLPMFLAAFLFERSVPRL